jgi:hypothetical protein
MPPTLPEQAVKQFIALLERGCCLLQPAWMACGLPWDQWSAFRRAYRSGEPSPWSALVARARRAQGLALALAWTELRSKDSGRWLVLKRDRQRPAEKTQDAWFAPAPGSLGDAIQELLLVPDLPPAMRERLTHILERLRSGPAFPDGAAPEPADQALDELLRSLPTAEGPLPRGQPAGPHESGALPSTEDVPPEPEPER